MEDNLESLISEIALSLNISEADVVSQFTQAELEQVFSQVTCVQNGQVGPIADDVNVQCNDIGPVIEKSTDALEITETILDSKQNCVDSVSDISETLKKELDEYTATKNLLDRLYEYRDSFAAISTYYESRSEECARILNLFQPLLILKESLTASRQSKIGKVSNLNALRQLSNNANQIAQYDSQIKTLNSEILEIDSKIVSNNQLLQQNTTSLPIYTDSVVTNLISTVSADSSNVLALSTGVTQYLSSIGFATIKNQIRDYSECVKVDNPLILSFSAFTKTPALEFKLDFLNLNGVPIKVEKTNTETGETYTEDSILLLKGNPLLQKSSFFESTDEVKITNNQIGADYVPAGAVYTKYYNKLSDPINNFFTLDERGLTDTISFLDPNLKNTQVQTKIENGKEYYIKNQTDLQNFYKEFEARFEERKNQVRAQEIDSRLSSLKVTLTNLASREIQLLLAVGGVNSQIQAASSKLNTIVGAINASNESMANKKKDLDSEIARLEARAEELKPDPTKIKKKLKETNPDCFGTPETADIEPLGCLDALEFAGIDPFFENVGAASSPLYPHQGQFCYWLEFSKIATLMGLLPIANSINEMRYWPVGLTIPTPVMLVKIPLPIIWVPLFVLPTPMGQFVLFLTINGVCITPMVFMNSSSGKKKFVLTFKGPSKDIGVPLESDKVFSKIISIPLFVKAAADLIEQANIKLTKGEFAHLAESEIKDLALKKTTLQNNLTEAIKSGDLGRILKLKDDVSKLTEGYSLKGKFSEAAKVADVEETPIDLIKKAKDNLFKSMNDLGNPAIPSLDKLKAELLEAKQKLADEKYAALANGNIEEYKKKRDALKNQGIPYDKIVDAFTADVLAYFDRVSIPSVKYPSDLTKIEPKPNPILAVKNMAEDQLNNNITGKLHAKQLDQKNKLILHLVKAKEEILSSIPNVTFNINENFDQFKDFLNVCVDKLIDSAAGIGGGAPTEEDIAEEIRLEDEYAAESTDEGKREKKRKLSEKKKKNARPLEKQADGEQFSKGSAFLSGIAATAISFAPFDVGAIKKGPSLEGGVPPVLEIAKTLLKGAVSSLTPAAILKLTGGVAIISTEDAITACSNLIKDALPDVKLPEPPLTLAALNKAISSPLSLTSEIKVPIPALAALGVPAQIPVNLELLKEPLKKAISEAIAKIPKGAEDNPLKNIESINSNDLKAFLTKTIDSNILKLETLISPILTPLSFAKSASGISLNAMDAAQFKVPPYGPLEEVIFNAKAIAKTLIPKSLTIPMVDIDILKEAITRLKPVLEPISIPPISYIIAASAGVSGNTQTLREIHPILQNDDLPPWERLSSKNILFLLFLDDFIANGADKTGLFRTFL